jgi:hypothetical protein
MEVGKSLYLLLGLDLRIRLRELGGLVIGLRLLGVALRSLVVNRLLGTRGVMMKRDRLVGRVGSLVVKEVAYLWRTLIELGYLVEIW